MPFITQAHRDAPDMMIPGDRAYREYQYLVNEWTKSPRWGTVDRLAERFYTDAYERAAFLSFLVFFAKHAMPYEHLKAGENGDIAGVPE